MIWLNVIIAHFVSLVFSLHTREVIIFGEEWSEMNSESQSRFLSLSCASDRWQAG